MIKKNDENIEMEPQVSLIHDILVQLVVTDIKKSKVYHKIYILY